MKKLLPLVTLSSLFALTLSAQVGVTVVSGASFRPNYPVAPGSYTQAWGDYQGFPTMNADLANLPLPTELGGVSVDIDGAACPLYAVTPQVVAFNVPQAIIAGRHTIQVTLNAQVVGQGHIDVIDESPGIFWSPSTDGLTRIGGVRRSSDFAYALEATPASRGGGLVIALTGQGTNLDAAVADGHAPDGLVRTNVLPKVYIGNFETEVTFSGLMPLFPGVWQLNAVIPDEPGIAGPMTLIVTYNGIASNEVIFWVAD